MNDPPPQGNAVRAALADLGRSLYARGWVQGTSGNFSAVLAHEPLRLAITSSGVDKGALSADHIVEVDAAANVITGSGRPSAETLLHLAVVRDRFADAVIHTHSIWSTILSHVHAAQGGVEIRGYEMLKGLSGVDSHEHSEWLPIIENSQDTVALSAEVTRILSQHPASHGFMVRRHGLYTWGRDLAEARRHIEILEFLLEAVGRAASVGNQVRME
jgi:methylthioribulose-1-phosphate dehydratase